MTRDGVLLVRQRRSLDEDGHTRLGRHGEDPWPTCHQVLFSPRAVDLFIGSKGNEACDGAPLEHGSGSCSLLSPTAEVVGRLRHGHSRVCMWFTTLLR